MIQLKVQGMHCCSCETILKEDVGEIPGISNVTADFKKGTVSFEGKPELRAKAVAAIQKNGYQVVG